MDRAKATVQKIIHRDGHHDTTVHERIAPAVVHERIEKKQHEEVQPVVDREVHVDHYHTTVQPIQARQVLPEQHIANIAPTEERHIGNVSERVIADRLRQEATQFKDVHVEGGTSISRGSAPTVVAEHKHHHVHEVIQPVIQKETVQPVVVHTTVPVHEVVQQPPQFHSASTLPPVTLDQYKTQGGVLTGREERYDGFEGEPRTIGTALGSSTTNTTALPGTTGTTGTTGHHASLRDKLDPRVDSDGDGRTGLTGATGTTGTTGTAGQHTSLRDKLDPRVDSNNDGRKGILA